MKKLIIEIPEEFDTKIEEPYRTTLQLEEGDFDAIQKLADHASLYVEFGAPHSNPELADFGIAECFAIDVQNFSIRVEDDGKV